MIICLLFISSLLKPCVRLVIPVIHGLGESSPLRYSLTNPTRDSLRHFCNTVPYHQEQAAPKNTALYFLFYLHMSYSAQQTAARQLRCFDPHNFRPSFRKHVGSTSRHVSSTGHGRTPPVERQSCPHYNFRGAPVRRTRTPFSKRTL